MQNSNVITNIRVIATLFIVWYHCCCPYTGWLDWGGYSFDNQFVRWLRWFNLSFVYDTMLPTFFLISGMVYFGRKELYKGRLLGFWKKFERLIVPMSLVDLLVRCLSSVGVVGFSSGHLWFVKVLFFYFCIAFLLYNLKTECLLIIGIVLHCIWSFVDKSPEMGWLLFLFMRYFIYFVLGHYANLYFNVLRNNRQLQMLLCIIAFFTLYFDWWEITRFVYSIAFNALLLAFIPNKEVSYLWWKSLNRNSFAIYLLHHIIIVTLFYTPSYQDLYANNAFLSIGSMFMIALTLSWSLSEGLHRVGFKYA